MNGLCCGFRRTGMPLKLPIRNEDAIYHLIYVAFSRRIRRAMPFGRRVSKPSGGIWPTLWIFWSASSSSACSCTASRKAPRSR